MQTRQSLLKETVSAPIQTTALLVMAEALASRFVLEHVTIRILPWTVDFGESTPQRTSARFMHRRKAANSSTGDMTDSESCHRSTLVDSVSCNVTGLTSFYSPHGEAGTSTSKELQCERNEGLTPNRSQEIVQYAGEQSHDLFHQDFTDVQQPFSGLAMDNLSQNTKREATEGTAILLSVATDVPKREMARSGSWYPRKTVSSASVEALRSSPIPSDFHRRASASEAVYILQTTAKGRGSPTRLFRRHVTPRELRGHPPSSEKIDSTTSQQPVKERAETSATVDPATYASSAPEGIRSNRECVSGDQPWPDQSCATASLARLPAGANAAELHATQQIRQRPSSPYTSGDTSTFAKDLVISALCDQIQHQQWKIKTQESRLYHQEQRLHELEAFVSSFQAHQQWKSQQQHNQQDPGQLLPRARSCQLMVGVESINEPVSIPPRALGPTTIPPVTGTNLKHCLHYFQQYPLALALAIGLLFVSNLLWTFACHFCVGHQWSGGIADSSASHAGIQVVQSATADPRWLQKSLVRISSCA